jgi:hypothetical protein
LLSKQLFDATISRPENRLALASLRSDRRTGRDRSGCAAGPAGGAPQRPRSIALRMNGARLFTSAHADRILI